MTEDQRALLQYAQDAVALQMFEALVLGQKPAETPWTPVTDYSFEAREPLERPHARLIVDVFQPDFICDAGMGPGHLVRLLRELLPDDAQRSCRVVGFDKQRGGTCYGDLGKVNFQWELQYRGHDLVICREVLEHLTIRQIRQAVTNLCRLSSRFVYLTTRFHLAPVHLLDVMTSDDLDPTHISMLNQSFLRALFVLEGFKRRADLEERLDWQKKGRCLVYERVA